MIDTRERSRRTSGAQICGGLARWAACGLGLLALASPARGVLPQSESALLLIDPTDAESMYVGNVYREARQVPASNVLYIEPGAQDYQEFAAVNIPALLGTLGDRELGHVDSIVLAPTRTTTILAPDLIADPCWPVRRLSITSAYALVHQADEILSGWPSDTPNEYASTSYAARGFDRSTRWLDGVESQAAGAQRYFLAGLLGYTGPRGNTVDEILAMIERSAGADGSHPAGTVYYMRTNDPARSRPRDRFYDEAVAQMQAHGGAASHLSGDLPNGHHDCMGVMTGKANLDIDGAPFTLLPGSFADHLTSNAGQFALSSQTKMSRWIAKGASATSGTVQEPCNYHFKFPHARLHVLVRQGLSLGEAWFRSLDALPFQQLFYGDLLTRPYSSPVSVSIPNNPTGALRGLFDFSLDAHVPFGVDVDRFEFYVDGRRLQETVAGHSFPLDTQRLSDGWHEVRVVAYDDTALRTRGSWRRMLRVDNDSRGVTLDVTPAQGSRSDPFQCDFVVAGGPVDEVRIVHNGRVVGAAQGSNSGSIRLFGENLGAGPVELVCEVSFADGRQAHSRPASVQIDFARSGTTGPAPRTFRYTKHVSGRRSFVVELPASFRDEVRRAEYTLVQAPSQATLLNPAARGPYRVFRPFVDADGSDLLVYRVTTPSGTSSDQTVHIRYEREQRSALAAFRNDRDGSNYPGFLATAPALGQTWTGAIDNAGTGSQFGTLLPFGRALEARLPRAGTLLVDPTAHLVAPESLPVFGGDGVVFFRFPLPNEPAYSGLSISVQGLSFGGPNGPQLLNAYDLLVGY